MRAGSGSRFSYANVMATLAVFMAIGGGTLAIGQATDGSGEIDACFVKRGQQRGDLRLLVKGTCRRNERPISWSEQGAIGPPGQAGQQGPPGPATGSAGGDLSGDYPNPQIAADAVGSAELADNTVDADNVIGGSLRMGDLAMANHQDLFTGAGGPAVPNDSCTTPITVAAPGAPANNVAIVHSSRGATVPGWSIRGLQSATADQITVAACNDTGAAASLPGITFDALSIGL